jgi:hypothetical protein
MAFAGAPLESLLIKETIMQTARILTIAALSAFATMGAQAAELNGDLYGTDFESKVQSVRSVAEVRAEGQKALPGFNQGPVADRYAKTPSVNERPAVRANGAIAMRANGIASGERS